MSLHVDFLEAPSWIPANNQASPLPPHRNWKRTTYPLSVVAAEFQSIGSFIVTFLLGREVLVLGYWVRMRSIRYGTFFVRGCGGG